MMLSFDRRAFLKTLACAAAASACEVARANDAALHEPLPAWTNGHFDIHHIDTARGNATLLVFPDGTALLIDAGAASNAPAGTTNPARPDNTTKSPGEVIALYVLEHAPFKELDYFLATHIHPDHVAGLTDVLRTVVIDTFIDRGFPRYAPAQQPVPAAFAATYLELLRARAISGCPVKAAQVGSATQIEQRRNAKSDFSARILSANGNVWNPATHSVVEHLGKTPGSTSTQGNENLFSVATRFTYGDFSYFTGGDLDCDTYDGRSPELDIETPVARAAGRTEVAVANHHGYFDACGPAFTNALDAQVYIIPSWDIGHPGSAQMQRMLGAWDSNGGKATHDVFALELLPQNALLNRRFASQLKSQVGHVVVRVAPGGGSYRIYTLDSTTENGNITGVFGPYRSRVSERKS